MPRRKYHEMYWKINPRKYSKLKNNIKKNKYKYMRLYFPVAWH